MNIVKIYPRRSRQLPIVSLLMIAFLPIIFTIILRAQNVDSLVQIINYSQSAKAINDTKRNIPPHMQKIDMKIIEVVWRMKAEGVSKNISTNQHLRDRFSTPLVDLDDQGNIHVEIYLKRLNKTSLDMLKASGVTIEYTSENFKQITCWLPFDIIENIAKDENVECLYLVGKPLVNIGSYTTAGDHILNADVARSTFGINGQNIKIGVISDGVDHWTSSRNQGDLPTTFQVINGLHPGKWTIS